MRKRLRYHQDKHIKKTGNFSGSISFTTNYIKLNMLNNTNCDKNGTEKLYTLCLIDITLELTSTIGIFRREKKSLWKGNEHFGDNCIVFENFILSIGDLMVAN